MPGEDLVPFGLAAVGMFMSAALDGRLGTVAMFDAFNLRCALADLAEAVAMFDAFNLRCALADLAEAVEEWPDAW